MRLRTLLILIGLLWLLCPGGNLLRGADWKIQPYQKCIVAGVEVIPVPVQSGWVLLAWPSGEAWLLSPAGSQPPPPPPPPPPELTGLAKDVRDWASAVQSPNRVYEARALAVAYRSVAADIASTRLKTLGDVQAAQKAANRKALGIADDAAGAKSPWVPFITKLAEFIVAQGLKDPSLPAETGGVPPKNLTIKAISLDVATGLEGVK